MANETIPLAKGLNIAKLEFPVYVSEKLDGVPVRFCIRKEGTRIEALAVTRQGENARSCKDYLAEFIDANYHQFHDRVNYSFVWEVTHVDFTGFKDISGVVRRQSPQKGLVFNLFDYDAHVSIDTALVGLFDASGVGFETRLQCAHGFRYPNNFTIIPQLRYAYADDLQDMLDNTDIGENQEGWVIRSHNAAFKPGKRHWDYQKVVKEPMIDLLVVGFEEGKGKNAGAVGRILVEYHGEIIGVGPGKLSYAERGTLWRDKVAHLGMIAQIKYKPDQGYKALRQPTFQTWRPDKTEPDA